MNKYLIKKQGEVSWILFCPHALEEALLTLLMELRGNILYNNGERPAFFNGTRVIADDDKLDAISYQLLMFNSTTLVGGLRITPIDENSTNSVLLKILHRDNYKKLLSLYKNQITVEGSRLFIHPNYRRYKNIINLYAGVIFVGSQIAKADILLSASGLKRKHDIFITKILEAKPIPEFLEPIWISTYNDKVRVTCIDLNNKPQKLRNYLDSFKLIKLRAGELKHDTIDLKELVYE